MTELDARHHVTVAGKVFCTLEWIERPEANHNGAVVRCPHNPKPLRMTPVRPTYRAAYLSSRFAEANDVPG